MMTFGLQRPQLYLPPYVTARVWRPFPGVPPIFLYHSICFLFLTLSLTRIFLDLLSFQNQGISEMGR